MKHSNERVFEIVQYVEKLHRHFTWEEVKNGMGLSQEESEWYYHLIAESKRFFEGADPKAEKLRLTEKGGDLIDAGSYVEWENQEKEKRQYIREAPQRERILVDSTLKTNENIRITQWWLVTIAGLTLISLIVQICIQVKEQLLCP